VRAKLLYLALRRDARFDAGMYAEVEDIRLYDVERDRPNFFERGWDVCNTGLTDLCRSVGIGTHNLREVVRELDNAGLIENDGFLVYHIPKQMLGAYKVEQIKTSVGGL